MKNEKPVTVLYTVQVSENTIKVLDEVITSGKNAEVLRILAVNMKGNKKLPKWASEAFDKSHFEQVFSLSATNLRKVCKTDSYAFIRNVVNVQIKNDLITEEQALKLKEVLKIQVFASNEYLKKILTRYTESLKIDENASDSILDSDTAKALKTASKAAVKTSEAFVLADQIKALNLDDALALQEILTAHIAELVAKNTEKAA